MKRLSLALVFACIAMSMWAQEAIRVNYQGSKPNISDFAAAFFSSFDDEECGNEAINAFRQAYLWYCNAKPQAEGDTFIMDEKNGYILYEVRNPEAPGIIIKMEMCYWNESDGKHKLLAYNNMASIRDGKPLQTETTDIMFYRYDNATKKMKYCKAPGFEIDYSANYALPRHGKNITVTRWNENGTKTQSTLKWNGRKFNK